MQRRSHAKDKVAPSTNSLNQSNETNSHDCKRYSTLGTALSPHNSIPTDDYSSKKKNYPLHVSITKAPIFLTCLLLISFFFFLLVTSPKKSYYEPGFDEPVRDDKVIRGGSSRSRDRPDPQLTKELKYGNAQDKAKNEIGGKSQKLSQTNTMSRMTQVETKGRRSIAKTITPGKNPANSRVFFNTHQNDMKLDLKKGISSPRIICITYNDDGILSSSIVNYKEEAEISFIGDSMPERIEIDPVWYEWNALQNLEMGDKCEPMHEWQVSSYPNCMNFHELELEKMRMINKGGSRIAFEINQSVDGKQSKFVFKIIKYSKDPDMKHLDQQRKDGLLMERLSSSVFVPDIYGYCGLAVMMDFMEGGNMHDYIKGARLAGGSSLAPVDKLRIAIHIATGVADLHSIDGSEVPTYIHNDICCHQFLFQDGIFKLGDFNLARPVLVKKGTDVTCLRDKGGMKMWKGRSLEEHLRYIDYPGVKPFTPDKVDVWMMGNIIYIILTDLYIFEWPENLSIKQTSKKLKMGKRSPYPVHIVNSTDPSYVAVKKALDMCWVQDFSERPSARQVSDYLMDQLRTITGEVYPDLRVILPERDKDQRPTDSEFKKYAK